MIELKGFDDLKKALTKMGDAALPIIQDAVNDAGNVVLRRVIAMAPGNLKNGLELKKAVSTKGGISGQIQLKKGFGYGVPVELGHRLFAWGRRTNKMIPERPYMRPAFDESKDEIEKIADAAMDKILREFGD